MLTSPIIFEKIVKVELYLKNNMLTNNKSWKISKSNMSIKNVENTQLYFKNGQSWIVNIYKSDLKHPTKFSNKNVNIPKLSWRNGQSLIELKK
jgi:hypothetical protein